LESRHAESRPHRYFGPRIVSVQKFNSTQFVSIALFSGVGLLVSLIAVIFGVQGTWY
jgi:hypothetical protein